MRPTATRLLLIALVVAGCGARTILREPTDAADTADASDGFTPVDVPITPVDAPLVCSGFETPCNGRCVDTRSDNNNCGACGLACGDSACVNGACRTAPCLRPTSLCGVRCVDLSSDPSNCGACNNVCGPAQTCNAGRCNTECGGPGRTLCGPTCVDLLTDRANCGACGTACPPGSTCSGGTCARPVTGRPYRIGVLSPDGCRTVDHAMVTGDDRGGIAVSRESVFYNGDDSLGRFDLPTLAPSAVGRVEDGLVSDLATGQVYSLRQRGAPLVPGSFAEITDLALLDGRTGAALGMSLRLSTSIPLSGSPQVGIFSGLGRAVILDSNRAYNIDLPSGAVTLLGSLPAPLPAARCESWAYWGVAELTDGAVWLAYVRNRTSIARTRVPDGETSTVGTFRDLGDMCSFTVSPDQGRWFWHNEGSSQFGDQQENVGYCPARSF